MTEVELERVAIVADGITLEPGTLLFVRDPELGPGPSLEAKSLLIDAQPLPRNPHLASVLIQLVKEMLHFPKRILLGLLLHVFPEVEHTHEPSEVLPTSDASDQPLATFHLLVHCLCNELVAKDIVVLEPQHWPRSKAVQNEEPHHLVDLFQIKVLVVDVDGPAESGALGQCSCIGGVDDATLDKLRCDPCVEEVFRTAVADFIRQEFTSGLRYMSFFGSRMVWVLRHKFGRMHLLLFTATVLKLGGPCDILDIRWPIESRLSTTKYVNTWHTRSWMWIENHPTREGWISFIPTYLFEHK